MIALALAVAAAHRQSPGAGRPLQGCWPARKGCQAAKELVLLSWGGQVEGPVPSVQLGRRHWIHPECTWVNESCP